MADTTNTNTISVNMENLSDDERKQLLAIIEKANKPNGVWKPKKGETYYIVTGLGRIESYRWCDTPSDNGGYNIGNCFRTEADALFELERRRVQHEVRVLSNDFKPGKTRYWYGLYYSASDNKVNVNEYWSCISSCNTYFESREAAQKAIDTIGVDRLKKYYFMVD